MGDDLYGATAVIAATFLLQYAPVNLTGRHVGILTQAFIDETLIVSQIQIRLGSVIGNENLTVLTRVHRAGVDVDVGIKLLHGDTVATGFQKSSKGCCGNSFSESGNYTAGNKYILYCHNLLLFCAVSPFLFQGALPEAAAQATERR